MRADQVNPSPRQVSVAHDTKCCRAECPSKRNVQSAQAVNGTSFRVEAGKYLSTQFRSEWAVRMTKHLPG
jgi:hypothetical protein